MATLSLRLPDSLHRQLAALAKREGVSINQIINSAVSEKMVVLMTEEYLDRRARGASPTRFKAALERVADIEPDDVDRLSDQDAGQQIWVGPRGEGDGR